MSAEDWTAGLDQMMAGLRDIAKILRSYFLELREQGFTDREALQLVVAWQAGWQSAGRESDDE